MKENLNEFVKHRESFRPFAIAVAANRAAEYFEYTPAARFMATLELPGRKRRACSMDFFYRARASVCMWWSAPPTRCSGNCSTAWAGFPEAPMLVNTSFNLFGEPLVVSPRDAVRSYFCSGVDALSIRKFFPDEELTLVLYEHVDDRSLIR